MNSQVLFISMDHSSFEQKYLNAIHVLRQQDLQDPRVIICTGTGIYIRE